MNDAENFPTVALQYATRQSEFALFSITSRLLALVLQTNGITS